MLIRTLATFTKLFKPSKFTLNLSYGFKRSVPLRTNIRYYFSEQNKQKPDQKLQKQKEEQIPKQNEEQKETVDESKKEVIELKEQDDQNQGFGRNAWNYVKNSWRHTFPDEEYEVKRLQKQRRVSMKETALKAQRQKQLAELAAAQAAEEAAAALAEQQQSNSLVSLAQEDNKQIKKQEKKKKKKSVSQASGGSFSISQKFKNMNESMKSGNYFGGSLGENMKTGDGKMGKGAQSMLHLLTDKQTISHASQQMRKIDSKFQTTDLEIEAKYLFVKTYNDFLKGNYDSFEKICSDQGYEYFKTQRNIMKARNIRPYNTDLIDVSSVVLNDASSGQGVNPSFTFTIVAQDVYCYYDNKDGSIIEGDPARIQSVTFAFTITFSEELMKTLGHPWEITQVVKLHEAAMLV